MLHRQYTRRTFYLLPILTGLNTRPPIPLLYLDAMLGIGRETEKLQANNTAQTTRKREERKEWCC